MGGRLLRGALARGHAVRALARDPGKLVQQPGLDVVAGDVLDPDAVARVVAGCDAALTALGGGGVGDPGLARSQGMKNVANALASAGISRVVALAGAGILDAPTGGLRNEQPGYPQVFARVAQEHMGTWTALRESSLDWTVFCPPDIINSDATGVYRLLEDLLPEGPGREIAGGDLAAAMLDAVERGTFSRRRVGIKI